MIGLRGAHVADKLGPCIESGRAYGLIGGFLGRLRKLTSEVGGKVYLTKVTEDLGDIYRDIEEELRSQYLISYYAQDLGGNRWRRVTVEVKEPGAEARTLSGYFR